jgi:hypothetical protein
MPVITPPRSRSTSTPSRARAAVSSPTPSRPVPTPTPDPDRGRPARTTEPLSLQPAAGPSRSLLLVLFVLLTVAAVVVGAFVLGGLGDDQPPPISTPQSAPDGSVTSREGLLIGPAAPGRPLDQVSVAGAGR